MAGLSLRTIVKHFNNSPVLDGVSFDVAPGEFFSILGPSGCGKTTLLRVVAGFEAPDGGSVVLGGRDVTRVGARQRGVGMVFQNYALFPHMTVRGNVAFGLDGRGLSAGEVRRRVEAMAEAVGLRQALDRPVTALSGGEQQRVAVARALVVEPAVLLFDEPLSNLDVALRARTREEIRALQRRFGITALYVTHDQAEAMSLSDRVAVMRAGALEQVGTPREVYGAPATAFVAGFVGGANLLRGEVREGGTVFLTGSRAIQLPRAQGRTDGPAIAALRPESVAVFAPGAPGDPATVESVEYLGFTTQTVLRWEGVIVRSTDVSRRGVPALRPGDAAVCVVDWSAVDFFPAP